MGCHALLGKSRQSIGSGYYLAVRLWASHLDSSSCERLCPLYESYLTPLQFLTIPPIAVMRLVFTALAYALSGYFLLKKFVSTLHLSTVLT